MTFLFSTINNVMADGRNNEIGATLATLNK
jgi:hypothetical protein